MNQNCVIVNLRSLIDQNASIYIGEEAVQSLLSDFSCPKNHDVEIFLRENAMQFTRKHQSVTYLVLDSETGALKGYYAIAIKPVSIPAANISKSMMKRLDRVSIFDTTSMSYTTAAYLIAQLGKNYNLPKEQQIKGTELLRFAMATIRDIQYALGGVVQFLECEDNDFLIEFYTNNGFKKFDERFLPTSSDGTQRLHQFLRKISDTL